MNSNLFLDMLTMRGRCVRSTKLTRLSSASLRLGFLGRRSVSSCEERPIEGKRFAAVWGNGDYGRLGLGSLESQWRPAFCSAFGNQSLQAIACGGAHTLFLTETGCVYATGLNDFGQLGISDDKSYTAEPLKVSGLPNEISKIVAGYHHSSAITVNGELYMWGKNSNGQLGLGKKAAKVISAPTKVESLTGVAIKMVALGSEHSLAVTDKGEALSWGGGESGRLGHGHEPSMLGFLRSTSEFSPRLIKKLEGFKIRSIAAGMLQSACIDENGLVFIFGERAVDKLGLGQAKNATRPSMIGQLPLSEEVACGGYHTCVITSGGELYTWGSNENGCLGTGCTDASHLPQRVQGPFLKQAVCQWVGRYFQSKLLDDMSLASRLTRSVSCGWKHTAAISGGHVYAWGWGGSHGTFSENGHSSGGQLGLGNDVDYIVPTRVIFGKNVKALQVSCGFNHTGAILEST